MNIVSVNHYVPTQHELLSEKYAEYGLSYSDQRIYQRFYGIEQIPQSPIHMEEMLIKVAEPILNAVDKGKVKYVVAPRTCPTIAPIGYSIVRNTSIRLGLMHAVTFATVSNKCVSLLTSFELIKNCLKDECSDALALVLTGESIFSIQNRLIPNISVTADAAAGALLSLQKHNQSYSLITTFTKILGEYAKGAWMTHEEVNRFGKIFNEQMSLVIRNALSIAGLTYSNIRVIFPHNVNIPCWATFAKYENISAEKIYLKNIAITAHCLNSDLLINLSTALKENILKPGDYFIMATVGVGAVFGAAIFRYNECEDASPLIS